MTQRTAGRRCSRPSVRRWHAAACSLCRRGAGRDAIAARPWTMWRYRRNAADCRRRRAVSLGEGATPLIPLTNETFVERRSADPTGSFKSRGMSVGGYRCEAPRRAGVRSPSAGNAGGALRRMARGPACDLRVYVPRNTPGLLVEEMRSYGAGVVLVDGLMTTPDDRGRICARKRCLQRRDFREPYRVEGKKTMGFELVEQLGDVPGTIVYPTGGGTGLVAMWEAFDELEQLG